MNISDTIRQWTQQAQPHHRAAFYLTVEYDANAEANLHFDTIGSAPALLAALEETLIRNDSLRLFLTIALRRARVKVAKDKATTKEP